MALRQVISFGIISALLFLLGSCGDRSSSPSGPVVSTVTSCREPGNRSGDVSVSVNCGPTDSGNTTPVIVAPPGATTISERFGLD